MVPDALSAFNQDGVLDVPIYTPMLSARLGLHSGAASM